MHACVRVCVCVCVCVLVGGWGGSKGSHFPDASKSLRVRGARTVTGHMSPPHLESPKWAGEQFDVKVMEFCSARARRTTGASESNPLT